MKRNEHAFTGLEAAIVLIAFVVVAAVFSYVMLGAGFFTAQKSQEVVHTGIAQAASSIELTGDVYGYGNTSSTGLKSINFTIALTSGMSPMNISAMVVSYADRNQREYLTYSPGSASVSTWYISKFFNNVTDDTVLEPTEKFTLTMTLPTNNPTPNTRFTILMQPEIGALTTVVRTVPASIYPVNILR
ncbi:MAG: flagellin [Methanocalculus sp.]|uniref:archaellin/type IV pilin N-terminal domain-containing protein n=1 Tax=Methanocalculus sp. TaxID=2004547 RepID=UPI0027163B2C|nr:archaellin/type IV pilin N-terminal domain-containing protein [Methanocalculus sp.]MDO8840750.1 flagellin [Methanocalculus sp.]MDO9539807.1 flagellin [Methanocalculus sp.]